MALTDLFSDALSLLPAAVAIRRDIHAHPELGNELPRTQEVIVTALQGLDLEIHRGVALTSVVAVLDTGRPGPVVLLRGDMDALPMPEDTDVDFASTIDGVMHACGHDTHVAMLIQAAHLLCARRSELSGKVVFMFQPGEEGAGGADLMIGEGLFDIAGRPDFAFAIHATPGAPVNIISTKPGPLMASADTFEIVVTGRGGHASAPHQALDPIPTACEVVVALQTMVTRRLDIFDPAVITVGKIEAGTVNNVIPETATITGTIRTLSPQTREIVRQYIEQVASGVASAHGARADVVFDLGYPVTVNDDLAAQWVQSVADQLTGQPVSLPMPHPVMGAEDFSYVLNHIPGCLVFLGMCPEGKNFWEVPMNHSNRVVFNEDGMTLGIALYAAVALERSRNWQ
jgi:hippurate hydrolase